MKTLIYILLLFSSFVSYSQTSFSDTLYCKAYLSSDEIRLNADKTFSYISKGCAIQDSGIGTYKIEKDIMSLKYISEDTLNSKVEISERDCKFNDSVNIFFKILDLNNKNLSGATILVRKINRVTNSNKDGTVIIKNLPKNQLLNIEIHYIGFEKIKLKVLTNVCKSIYVKLKELKGIINKNGLIKMFTINKSNANSKDTIFKSKNSSLTLTPIIEKEEDD